MLAAHHDQENLVALRQGSAKNRVLGQGALYPKTPLKIPLNDENSVSAIGGKAAVLGTKGLLTGTAKQSLVTPMARRAPLGNKTTNAKARSGRPSGSKGQTSVGKKPGAAAGRPKNASPGISQLKVAVQAEAPEANDDLEVEYAPPPPAELPYESDVFPDGTLTLDGLKRENLFRGYYEHFYNPLGEDGVRLKDRELRRSARRAAQSAEERAKKAFDEIDWSVSDVPETRKIPSVEATKETNRRPGTTTSRRAASALSVMADGPRKPAARSVMTRPLVNKTAVSRGVSKERESARARTVSRNTLGYNKGRSASGMLKSRPTSSAAIASAASLAKAVAPVTASGDSVNDGEAGHVPDFLSIFHDEEADAGLGRDQELVIETEEDFELRLDD